MKRWWERRTLRFRLALWYSVGGTVLLAGFSATLYFFVEQRMARPLDHELRRDLARVQASLTLRDGRVFWQGAEVPSGIPWPAENPWFEIWDENGRLLRRLWPFTESRVNRVPTAPPRGHVTISVFDVAEDVRLRVLSVPYPLPGHEHEGMMRVMSIHQPAADPLRDLSLVIVIALPVVVALLVLGGYSITRKWLKPLDQMVAEATQITVSDLSRRLSAQNAHGELGRLATVFNVTLDRLESSFLALDRFAADASHELRTPLTTLRSVGEVGLRRGRSVEEYREIIGSMLEEAQRLQLLIQRLLELATAESGAAAAHRAPVDVKEFVGSCVNELAILAEAKNQRIDVSADPGSLLTDPVLLRQALQNLVDNAIKYSPEGSAIAVTARDAGPQFEITVADEGPGISAENQAHLTERFFRPDRGRGRTSGGFGLGLSITKAYMRVLGGSLHYAAGQPRGSTFQLRLPKTV
jgi:two-component system OmpR family sensor kinase